VIVHSLIIESIIFLSYEPFCHHTGDERKRKLITEGDRFHGKVRIIKKKIGHFFKETKDKFNDNHSQKAEVHPFFLRSLDHQ
jgi:hypothetical protein